MHRNILSLRPKQYLADHRILNEEEYRAYLANKQLRPVESSSVKSEFIKEKLKLEKVIFTVPKAIGKEANQRQVIELSKQSKSTEELIKESLYKSQHGLMLWYERLESEKEEAEFASKAMMFCLMEDEYQVRLMIIDQVRQLFDNLYLTFGGKKIEEMKNNIFALENPRKELSDFDGFILISKIMLQERKKHARKKEKMLLKSFQDLLPFKDVKKEVKGRKTWLEQVLSSSDHKARKS